MGNKINSTDNAAVNVTDIKLLALDVDGVLTDGTLYFGIDGDMLKAFNSLDGHGLKMLHSVGISIAIITGRTSRIVEQRAAELGIDVLLQGREDKLTALSEVCEQLNLTLDQAAYMGDDLPDLAAIQAAGLGISVPNAATGVAERADMVTRASGGKGAVREACERILQAQGYWQDIETSYRMEPGVNG
ncbi:MAG: KdsC family phosphatase [Pseudomonadales bacterium]